MSPAHVDSKSGPASTGLRSLTPAIRPESALTALAPMQDVTDLAFMGVIHSYGDPDFYFTEFFRVHTQSQPERHIVRSIVENPTGRPVFAQLIGESIPDLLRTARTLLRLPVAGIDLNLGCPAPKVYKKNVGGGLLRDPVKIGQIFEALRGEVPGLFTVKMRIGFDDTDNFERILDLVARHGIDLLSIHGRTVKEMYRSEVHYDYIGRAVRAVPCPVLANGNVTSAARARRILDETGAAGVMIGRSAIRNPWIFAQIRATLSGEDIPVPKLDDVYGYIERLWEAAGTGAPERARVNRMKKFLNFVGQAVDREGCFLYEMRRAVTAADLFEICRRRLLESAETPFPPEPFPGIIARPNCETPETVTCSL